MAGASQAVARLLGGALLRRAGQSASQQLFPAACLAAAAQQAPLAQQLGAFSSTSARCASSDSRLASILKKEFKHEQREYEKPDIIAKGPPAPFTLSSAPGDTAVSLKRDYNGEQISVDCSVNLQDSIGSALDGDDEMAEGEDEFEQNDVNFNVTVTKGDQALVFEVVSDGTYVDVRHVSLEPAEGHESETAYTGPVFQELDDELQQGFRDYLEERGINEDVGEYLRFLMFDKEQAEYMGWLQRVQEFMASKPH